MPKRVAERATATHPDEQLVRAYLDVLLHQRRLSASTLVAYRQALDVLCVLAQDARLETLDTARLRRFVGLLHAQGLSGRTLAKTLSAWRGLYRWLVRHRRFRANPVQLARSDRRSATRRLSAARAPRVDDLRPRRGPYARVF